MGEQMQLPSCPTPDPSDGMAVHNKYSCFPCHSVLAVHGVDLEGPTVLMMLTGTEARKLPGQALQKARDAGMQFSDMVQHI